MQITQMGLYGERLGQAFRTVRAPSLATRTRGGHDLAVTELRCDDPGFGMTGKLPGDDAYLVVLHLVDVSRHEMWLDGRRVQSRPLVRGDVCFHDLRRDPVSWLGDPFHLLAFYVPRAALAEVADELGRRPVLDFAYDDHRQASDPVVASLGQSLLPFLGDAPAANQLYVDHVFLALRSHLAVTYGGLPPAGAAQRGGLAPWQRKRALELLSDHLAEGIRLDALSEACRLSSSAFLRAFRKTMGLAPHQWLLARRIERARELIREGALPLSEIALCAGFADQSHFTRVFSQQMGTSPGAWRRAQSTVSSMAREPACLQRAGAAHVQVTA